MSRNILAHRHSKHGHYHSNMHHHHHHHHEDAERTRANASSKHSHFHSDVRYHQHHRHEDATRTRTNTNSTSVQHGGKKTYPNIIGQYPIERNLPVIVDMIQTATQLPAEVKRKSIAVFQVLAEAEAKTHNCSLEEVQKSRYYITTKCKCNCCLIVVKYIANDLLRIFAMKVFILIS